MRRVVVFVGGSHYIAAALQRTVPACLDGLSRAGVVVPTTGRRTSAANGLSHQRLAAMGEPGWAALRSELAESEANTVLLIVPALLRTGRAAARQRAVVAQLSALADEVRVVSVVADQLTLINDYYLHHVATWRTSGRLDTLAARLIHNEGFVHERLLRPWYQDAAVRYTAVPLPEYLAVHPVRAVLGAAGVELPADVAASPVAPAWTLGAVGVEANRLLSTYLRAEIPGFQPDASALVAASHSGLARADKAGWCADEFWGWTRRSAKKARARFDASNDRFARAVWGTDWPLPYPLDRPCTQLDFLDLDAEVIDQVQRYVVSMVARVARNLQAAS